MGIMIKRRSIHLLVQLVVLFLAITTAGSSAILMAGAIGGVAMGVAPGPTFGLVAGVICPQDASLSYYEVERSYHDPGESEPHVECVGQDGTEQDVLLKAILSVLGLTFVGVFLATFILIYPLLVIAGVVLTRKVIAIREG